MSEKISIQNLVKNFDEKEVLRGINLQVNKGESLVILGGSGSGKSVLIKIIATLISPSLGSIKIDGEEFEFSDGFADLHTTIYHSILTGMGYGLSDVEKGIRIVEEIRQKKVVTESQDGHPYINFR